MAPRADSPSPPSFVTASTSLIPPSSRTSFISPSACPLSKPNLPRPSTRPYRVSRTLCAQAQPSATPRREYFVTCAQGLGPYLAAELRSPHVNATVTATASSGVHFVSHDDSHATAYAACLWLRTATRVLYKLATVNLSDVSDSSPTFSSQPVDAVYQATRDAVHWPRMLDRGRLTFIVQARCSGGPRRNDSAREHVRGRREDSRGGRNQYRDFRERGRGRERSRDDRRDEEGAEYVNEQVVQTRVKDAVCDALRDAGFPKPDRPDSYAFADVPLFVTVHDGVLTLYLDMGGGSLHKRGYRADRAVHRAQLNESVAAGMLYAAGFDALGRFRPDRDIRDLDTNGDTNAEEANPDEGLEDLVGVDPMCGSGTLLTELCLLRLQTAVGLFRRDGFAFERWDDFDPRTFDAAERAALRARRSDDDARLQVLGSDVNERAVRLAASDVHTLGLERLVSLQHCDVRDARVRGDVDVVLSNPPWGRRLNYSDHYGGEADSGAVDDAWMDLGDFFRQQAPGATAVVISGDAAATRGLRMKARRKVPVRIGNVDTRVLVYDVLPPKNT